MKTYSIDAETSTRVYKKWIINADSGKIAISIFAKKIHRPLKSFKKIKCTLINKFEQ